jgi:hypothetical protein
MKKEHLILLVAGALVVFLIIKGNKKRPAVLQPGDKGNEVYALQYAISRMTGVKFENMGAYDNYTLDAVRYYMENTTALVDSEAGLVDKNFASDLMMMQSKLNK